MFTLLFLFALFSVLRESESSVTCNATKTLAFSIQGDVSTSSWRLESIKENGQMKSHGLCMKETEATTLYFKEVHRIARKFACREVCDIYFRKILSETAGIITIFKPLMIMVTLLLNVRRISLHKRQNTHS